MTTVRPSRTRRRRPRVAGRRVPQHGFPALGPGTTTVQLLPAHLAAEQLPPAAVGDELEVSPAIFVGGHRPAHGSDDRWELDELGGLAARGLVLSPPAPEPPAAPISPDVLDVAGLLYPVNWGASGGPGAVRLEIEGALYLDPELCADSEFGESVSLCRRWYRVQAIRRYHRTAFGPRAPVRLAAVPEPSAVSEAAVYVADLVLLEEAALTGAGAGPR